MSTDKQIMSAYLAMWQAARNGNAEAFKAAFTEAVNAAYRAGTSGIDSSPIHSETWADVVERGEVYGDESGGESPR